MANNEIGGFLNITPDVLNKLDSFDKKLEQIEKHSKTAADALKSGFSSINQSTSTLSLTIGALAKQIEKLNTAGITMRTIGESAQGSAKGVSTMNESLSRAADLLNRIGNKQVGQGSFSGWNIAELKEGISDLKKFVENTKILSKVEQQKAVEAMRYMKMELDYQRKSEEQKTQTAAQESKKRIDQIRKERAEESKRRERITSQWYSSSASRALSFSSNTKSLGDEVKAIEYLKKARLSLNTSTEEGRRQLNAINAAIAQHNRALQQAGVQSQSLARNQRNLMDTAGQLKRQLALLFSVSQIEGYISKIATVRGEFEITQRSLQAILQNKTQADKIFGQVVELAVKSPFRIKDLASYAKQLAAYRIESDKLFDTTKRLADVSAGLGVDMQRLILAYGQVKSAVYLRGTEVRQFTEAGINIYGELQKLFKARDQADYTTAQIVDMISKRKVTFEDIETIFKNLTEKGGLFYNMQEIQAETLQGKISNLKDSIDIMLNSIGKANEDTLKGSIDAVKVLIDNWETVVNVAKTLAPIFASMGIVAWNKKIMAANAGLGLFSVGLGKAGNAIKAFGATFKASLPLMAVMATIGVITELISTVREYNKAIAESTNKYFEAKIRISTIQDESKSDIKKALDKLVQEMNNEGFEIKIKAGISEEEAKDEFNRYLKDYEIFLNEQKLMEARYARNKAKLLVDDIDEDSEDYASSVGEFILQGEELKTVMMQLATEENNLSSEHKKTLEQLAKGPKEGEDVLSYTKRMKDEIAKMWPALNQAFNNMRTGNGAYTKEAMEAIESFTRLFELSKGYTDDEKKMISELEEVFGKFDKNMDEAAKKRLRIRIDKSELDAVAKELAYRYYKLNVEIDKEEVKKEALTLKDQLQAEFDRNKITISVDYATSGNGLIDYWMDGQEQMQKTADVLKKQLEYVRSHPDQYYLGGELQKMGFDLSGIKTKRGKQADENTYIDSKRVEAEIQKRLEALAKEGIAPKERGSKASKASKAERDIWAERISVLKEMQARYEKLNELMGENAAIEQTLSAFKPALEFTGMGDMSILPTKEGMIKAYEELLKDVSDSKKITEIKKIIAELKLEIQQDKLKEQLDKTKQNIEDMFNGLDLHQKLKDAGLSEAEVQALFPGLAKTLNEVERGIHAQYDALRGSDGSLGETQQKAYDDALNKLNQQRIKESQDLAQRLAKDYKTQLSEQLQLDIWYYKEKANIAKSESEAIARIEADANLSEQEKSKRKQTASGLSKQMLGNLTSQYNMKSDENAWKQFQESDFYIDLFQNLDNVSTKTLVAMRDKLAQMKEQLNDLKPSDVKAIVNNMEELNEVLAGRNPFKELIPSLKSYIGSLKDRKKHEDAYLKALEGQEKVEKRLYGYTKTNEDGSKERVEGESEVLAKLEAEYNALVENENATQEQKDEALDKLNTAKETVKKSEEELANNKQITDQKKKQVDADKKKLDAANKSLNEVAKYGAEAVNAVSEFTSMLEGFGVEIPEWLEGTTEGLGQIFDGLGSMDLTRPFSIVTGAIKTIAGIGKTIGSVFGIKNKDEELQKEIEKHEQAIKRLQKAYDVLKEKMDLAWSAASLSDMNKQTLQNVDAQIASYQAMIRAEEDKKKTDHDRIEEWKDAIKELEKTRKELQQQAIEEMGGIGETNYKDAASEFVSAWVDAFNESEDALLALQDTFDGYITNLVKKQATMRLVQARMKSVFEAIDKSVTEGSAGGINLTKEELANIQKMGESALAGLNEDLLNLMETLGYKPSGGKAELSALTQSIQGLSESTAEELAALLNSVRFFVSQQTTDISAIRTLLESRYSLESEYSDSNPMLVELRAQTGYLERITDYISSVFTYNANSKGAGLRVFMA